MSRLFSQHSNLYSPAQSAMKHIRQPREIAGRASKPHCPAKKSAEKSAPASGSRQKTRETFPAFLRAPKGAQIPKTGAGAIFCGATKPPPRPEHRQKMPQQRARGRSKARGHYPSTPLANMFRRFPESLSRRRRSPELRPPRK